jgi:hypothetical protein
VTAVSIEQEAIVALLTHRTIEEAARSIGVDPKTLLRWMKEPDLDAAYRAAKLLETLLPASAHSPRRDTFPRLYRSIHRLKC